jgi:hypothetical protein
MASYMKSLQSNLLLIGGLGRVLTPGTQISRGIIWGPPAVGLRDTAHVCGDGWCLSDDDGDEEGCASACGTGPPGPMVPALAPPQSPT